MKVLTCKSVTWLLIGRQAMKKSNQGVHLCDRIRNEDIGWKKRVGGSATPPRPVDHSVQRKSFQDGTNGLRYSQLKKFCKCTANKMVMSLSENKTSKNDSVTKTNSNSLTFSFS